MQQNIKNTFQRWMSIHNNYFLCPSWILYKISPHSVQKWISSSYITESLNLSINIPKNQNYDIIMPIYPRTSKTYKINKYTDK
jgi:hypothetical protein